MLGEYRIFARSYENLVPWTLTATIRGADVWIENGVLTYQDSYYTEDLVGRRLYTLHDSDTTSYTYYSASDYPQSDTFTVTLDTYDPAGC